MSATTITRKFSLIPNTSPISAKIKSYKETTNLLVKVRALKNEYVSLMVDDIKTRSYSSYVATSMSKFRQAVYDRLRFSSIKSPQFQKIELKERAKQCAFYDAYLVVREWVRRSENLKIIINELINKFLQDEAFTLSFLRGKRFSSNELKSVTQLLKKDCFNQRQFLSVFFLNNYIFQLRNLFLTQHDFKAKQLFSNGSLANSLQVLVKNTFQSLTLDKNLVDKLTNGFSRIKKAKKVNILPSELPNYILNSYFRKLQWITTQKARQIITLRKKMKKEAAKKNSNKFKLKNYSNTLQNLTAFLSTFLGDIEFSGATDFKKKRKLILDGLKKQISERLPHFDLSHLITKAYQKELFSFQQNLNQYVFKRVFKPQFPQIQIQEITYDSFIHYFEIKIRYKLRELLKDYFISSQFISLMIKQFQEIKLELYNLVKIPEHKTLSISIMNRDVYKEDFPNYKIQLGLLTHQFKTFHLRDKKDRIKKLVKRGFDPSLPTITLKNHKLLLNLPFKKIKKASSKPSQVYSNPNIEMGIDLGLKHFAVLCIWDKQQQRELARYFLGPRQIFDKSFNLEDGKLYNQERVRINQKSTPLSNIKLKLIHLREQIMILQRKKNTYDDRLLLRKNKNPRTKLKWNKLTRSLSLCWDRVTRLNIQIVNHLNNYINKIAAYWKVSAIKVEDLRWASHSKKRDAGKFLAFWQTHWFYSQVQTAVKVQCELNALRFQKIPARLTSQRCSCCGNIGLRNSKQFSCPHCGFKLDSDLNAARNIAKYQKCKISIKSH